MIPAGSLDRRLTIHSGSVVRSASGNEKYTWTVLATVWAGQQRLSIADSNRMAGRDDGAEAKFVIRYRTDLTTSCQIECEGRRWVIVSIDELGRREGLALLVRAI